MFVDPKAVEALRERGWKPGAEGLTWSDELGSELRLASTEAGARVKLLVDGAQVLGFELKLEPTHLPKLVAALAANTEMLAGLRHAPFAKAAAEIAAEVVIETTDGPRVRARLENGQLRYEPIID
jgi:hypothetical protein